MSVKGLSPVLAGLKREVTVSRRKSSGTCWCWYSASKVRVEDLPRSISARAICPVYRHSGHGLLTVNDAELNGRLRKQARPTICPVYRRSAATTRSKSTIALLRFVHSASKSKGWRPSPQHLGEGVKCSARAICPVYRRPGYGLLTVNDAELNKSITKRPSNIPTWHIVIELVMLARKCLRGLVASPRCAAS
jgi:hypothetical protein